MKEYKREEIYVIAENLFQLSSQINNYLVKAKETCEDFSSEINSLYSFRMELLDNISNFVHSNQGKIFLSEEKQIWDKVLIKIADIELMNITLMDEVISRTRMDLISIRNKQKVFVYSKGVGNANKFDFRK